MRSLFFLILQTWPGKLGIYFRSKFYSRVFGHEDFTIIENVYLNIAKGNVTGGKRLKVCPDVKLFATSGNLILGENIFFNFGCFISADRSTITIGDNCSFGNNVTIWSSNHCFESKIQLIIEQGYTAKKIEIGNDVWIGCNVTILPGAIIEDGCVLASGSAVLDRFTAYSVIGGGTSKNFKKRGGNQK